MKIAITGGAGMLGQRLAARLLDEGLRAEDGRHRRIEKLTLFDRAAAAPSADPRIEVASGDIADAAAVGRALGEADAVFHLAAVVSAAAEADLDLGLRVNLDGTRCVLEACRAMATAPRLIFASSVAVFSGDKPATVNDDTPPDPRTSYGAQKVVGELLVGDYSRRGLVDGRCLRLPTVVVRPGRPNKAASTFASSILREPLAGREAVCPVTPETRMWILSPRKAVESLIHACALAPESWGRNRSLNLPGLDVSVGEMVEALRTVAGDDVARRVRWRADAGIQRIVGGWPARIDAARAVSLGFAADADMAAIVRAFIDDDLTEKAQSPSRG